ncbi:hypothetical protein MTO96_039544 [Rhipicephalus appendiculatus]
MPTMLTCNFQETLDRRSSPCDDLHAYVCSGWMREHSFTSTHDRQMELLTWHARSGLQRIASQRANATTSSVTSGNRLNVPGDQQPPDHR